VSSHSRLMVVEPQGGPTARAAHAGLEKAPPWLQTVRCRPVQVVENCPRNTPSLSLSPKKRARPGAWRSSCTASPDVAACQFEHRGDTSRSARDAAAEQNRPRRPTGQKSETSSVTASRSSESRERRAGHGAPLRRRAGVADGVGESDDAVVARTSAQGEKRRRRFESAEQRVEVVDGDL